jgi:glucokinase
VLFPAGQVLARRTIATRPARDGYAVLQDTLDLAGDLVREAASMGHVVDGIGAGVAELVDHSGEVTSGACIPWRGIPLRQQLARLAPAVVDADVRVAALGEALYGAGSGYDCFVYVSIGTGISYSLVQDGQPFAGVRGNALVLASGPTSHVCRHCGQQSTMVLEEFASGPAIARRYAELTHRALSLNCGGGALAPPASAPPVTGEDVTRAASAGDVKAIDVVRSAGTALGSALGFLVNVLDPAAIVIGGGLGLAGGHYWEALVESTRAHIWADGSRELPMVTAGLGADAGIIGAAAAFARDRSRVPGPAKEIG